MPGPFPDRTVAAVGACARALSGSATIDALLTGTDAATIGGLRAFADRLAVRHRFHDPTIQSRHQPTGSRASDLFAALESARLDVLGVRWLPGIARNLMAHPGAGQDAVRWLAFETLSGRPAPPEKSGVAARIRSALPSSLLEELSALARCVDDHEGFAAAAAAWAKRAGAHLPQADEPVRTDRGWPPRARLRQLPKRGDPGSTAAPLTRTRPDASHPDAEGTPGTSASTGATDALRDRYRAFTTAYDRVVNAATLASREELDVLHVKLEAELGTIRSVVARLAKRLLRMLMARQTREWRFDLDEGLLDASRLAPFIAGRGAARPFKQEGESPFPGTAVSLLIDHSGSMRGRPMLIAALTVEIFARVLERCGVRCEVLGFTTRDWDGGEPAREWAARGYPASPGRLNALEHIVVKGADVPWRRARIGLGLFLRDDMLKENIDGEALTWAHDRLLTRTEPRRILVVVSDGTPMDEATMAANGHQYLEGHLQEVIERIETRSPVQLAAIGIGHDVSMFYGNATTIARIDDLGPALTGKLMALLDPDGPRSTRRRAAAREGPAH